MLQIDANEYLLQKNCMCVGSLGTLDHKSHMPMISAIVSLPLKGSVSLHYNDI